MHVEIIIAVIGAIEGLGVALIGAMMARSNKRNDEYRRRREQREQAREERDKRIYNLVFATASGTEVLLHQAHGERVNGNVDEALAELREAKAECNRFLNEQAAKLS